MLAGFKRGNLLAWKCSLQKKILRRKVSRDTALGYPVWRAWSPWEVVKYVTEKEKPDLIVVMAVETVRMALAAKLTKRLIPFSKANLYLALRWIAACIFIL